ncbi:lysophospholipase [Pseudenhygromyxa sp. WMMC2535]|uniref:alpha/beta fold hydrolase n=1 Tax=Pseudenhygromyxa sp. WMMC2535 TaxID=2712867 RepID=UPI001553174B|nr:lysophospholipase [Pseudenhygromyxa sp. WMMC2535]
MTERFHLTTNDGVRLHGERWSPAGTPRFVVCAVHGQGEHVSRYDRVARELGERGGLVFGVDHRGQGRSGGAPGYVDRFETYASDLLAVIRHQVDTLGEAQGPQSLPWFLFGHSMGGLITLTYLLDHQHEIDLRGVVISSPLLGLALKVGPLKRQLTRLAAKLLPRLPVPTGLEPETICRDPEEVARYAADPRRVRPVTPGWAVAMEDGIARVDAEVGGIEVPMHWYVGTGDLICDHRETERIFASLPDPVGRDQSLEVWPGYYHELHNEPEELRAPVMRSVYEWIEARC